MRLRKRNRMLALFMRSLKKNQKLIAIFTDSYYICIPVFKGKTIGPIAQLVRAPDS